MKITRAQLRTIIREAIDVMNGETGELLVFDDRSAAMPGRTKPDAPEAAALDMMRRLGITVPQPDPQYSNEVPTYVVSGEDYDKMETELYGKRSARSYKADKKRLDIDNLLDRVQAWAMDAGQDYLADNKEFPGSLADVAYDMAQAAEMEFKPDEWNELLNHFEYNDDDLRTFIADVITMQED